MAASTSVRSLGCMVFSEAWLSKPPSDTMATSMPRSEASSVTAMATWSARVADGHRPHHARAGRAAVEVAAEPAGGDVVLRAARLPDVHRLEVRQVGLVVADALDDADLAGLVELGQLRQRGGQPDHGGVGEL